MYLYAFCLIFHMISYGLLWLNAIWPKLSKIAPSYMYKITGPEKLNKTVSKNYFWILWSDDGNTFCLIYLIYRMYSDW